MNESRKRDQEIQDVVRREVEALPAKALLAEAVTGFKDVLDGKSWWDLQSNTGSSEAVCRRQTAVYEELYRRGL